MEPVWLALVVVGALNWGVVGVFDTNLVAEIFGTGTVVDVVYAIIGIAGTDDGPPPARGVPPQHAPHARHRRLAGTPDRPGVHTRAGGIESFCRAGYGSASAGGPA